MRMFMNDYSEGACPQIMDALLATNGEQCVGYTEGDPHCERARELIRTACGRDDVDVEFCIGGTSANVIGMTGLLEDWEGVICTPDGHINVHETGAVAACGRTVLPTDDADGFLSPSAAERVWQFQTSCGRHMTRPGASGLRQRRERAVKGGEKPVWPHALAGSVGKVGLQQQAGRRKLAGVLAAAPCGQHALAHGEGAAQAQGAAELV